MAAGGLKFIGIKIILYDHLRLYGGQLANLHTLTVVHQQCTKYFNKIDAER